MHFFTYSIQNKQAFIPGPELPLSGEGYLSRTAGRGLKDKVSSFLNQATVDGCGTFFSGEFVHSNARLAEHGREMLGEGNPFWSSTTSMARETACDQNIGNCVWEKYTRSVYFSHFYRVILSRSFSKYFCLWWLSYTNPYLLLKPLMQELIFHSSLFLETNFKSTAELTPVCLVVKWTYSNSLFNFDLKAPNLDSPRTEVLRKTISFLRQ